MRILSPLRMSLLFGMILGLSVLAWGQPWQDIAGDLMSAIETKVGLFDGAVVRIAIGRSIVVVGITQSLAPGPRCRVREAMAEVWIKQGNTAKAEEIYRKLSLLDPLKTAYFAAKIEDLKKTS